MNRQIGILLIMLGLVACFLPVVSAQQGYGWDNGNGIDGIPTATPTPTNSLNPTDQTINNEYAFLPLLTLLVVLVIGGLVLTAYRGDLDGAQLITGFLVIIVIGIGAAIAVSILANIQVVTKTWSIGLALVSRFTR